MRALLDINVVIALLDPDHVFHDRAHVWWAENARFGWASCPIVENGVVRIMAHPAYSGKVSFSPADLIGRLQLFASQTDHEFWPDDLSLGDDAIFVTSRIHGSKLITDIYLLAIAVKHEGRLVTFDQGIPASTVRIAGPENLCAL